MASFSAFRVYPQELVPKIVRTGFGTFTTYVWRPAVIVTSRGDLAMPTGQHFRALAEFINQDGDVVTACSQPFKVDTTPPEFVGVIEHLDPLAAIPTNVTSHHGTYLAARWTSAFVDPDSNAAVPLDYAWRIHTAPVAIVRSAPTFTTALTEVSATSVLAHHGRSYYVTVFAQNRAGLITHRRSRLAVLVDHTRPASTVVRDGTVAGRDVGFIELTPGATFGVNWDDMVEDFGEVTYVRCCRVPREHAF